MVNDINKLVALWTKASELAIKFFDEEKAVLVVSDAGKTFTK